MARRLVPIAVVTVLAIAGAVAVVLLGLAARWRHGHDRQAGRPVTDAPASLEAVVAQQRDAVDGVVAKRNAKNGRDEVAFVAAGWHMVASRPPDMRVVDLDPTLIAIGREPELRTQLASAVPQARNAHRMADIAVMGHDAATRESAVDALSRLRTPESQEELARLLTSGKLAPEDAGRRQIAALIQPTDLDDGVAARMAGLLDAGEVTARERRQLAFTLALVGLRDGMALPERVTETMSPEAVALIDSMTAVARKNLVAHAHESPEGGSQ